MSQNTEVVERWIDILSRKAVAEIANVFHADGYVTYGAGGLPDAHGPAAIGDLLGKFYEGFPDLHCTVEEIFDADDSRVVGRFLTKATHTGAFLGLEPTGRQIAINGIAIYRIRDGKIAHEWNMDDLLGLLQQIGAVPAPAA